MSSEMKNMGSKPKKRVLKGDKNKTFFTKKNLKFGSRNIPTLEEMILERNYNLQSRHCSLSDIQTIAFDSSVTKAVAPEIDHWLPSDSGNSFQPGQISPSTVSFATLYKGTSTLKSNLPVKTEKSPYRKYIIEQKRLEDKCQNIEEEQLERLEKETEEDILAISKRFCEKVKSWDKEDNTVAEALQSLPPVNSTGGTTGDPSIADDAIKSKMQGLTPKEDLAHLTDPDWISNLFRICFGSPWLEGFAQRMREAEATSTMCVEVGIPVTEMRRQRVKIERVRANKILSMEAAKPRVAFGCTVPRAKGLDDFLPKSRIQSIKKLIDDPLDLVTMRAVWGNLLNSRSVKHYCKHLRELIKEKMEGKTDADPNLAAVTLAQMKPLVLMDAGLLADDDLEAASVSSSLYTLSSSMESKALIKGGN